MVLRATTTITNTNVTRKRIVRSQSLPGARSTRDASITVLECMNSNVTDRDLDVMLNMKTRQWDYDSDSLSSSSSDEEYETCTTEKMPEIEQILASSTKHANANEYVKRHHPHVTSAGFWMVRELLLNEIRRGVALIDNHNPPHVIQTSASGRATHNPSPLTTTPINDAYTPSMPGEESTVECVCCLETIIVPEERGQTSPYCCQFQGAFTRGQMQRHYRMQQHFSQVSRNQTHLEQDYTTLHVVCAECQERRVAIDARQEHRCPMNACRDWNDDREYSNDDREATTTANDQQQQIYYDTRGRAYMSRTVAARIKRNFSTLMQRIRYGKTIEQRSLDYINAYTQPCPHCGIRYIKNGGCNHMTCPSCSTSFTWNVRTVRTRMNTRELNSKIRAANVRMTREIRQALGGNGCPHYFGRLEPNAICVHSGCNTTLAQVRQTCTHTHKDVHNYCTMCGIHDTTARSCNGSLKEIPNAFPTGSLVEGAIVQID